MAENLASALVYKDGMEAPVIICNGRARIAAEMIEAARENDVPVVYDSELAETLSVFNAGDCVPVETWKVLAGVFAFIRGQIETASENKER